MYQASQTQLEKVFNEIPKVLNSNGLTNHCIQWISDLPSNLVLITIASVLVVVGSLASISSIPHNSLPPTERHHLFDPSDLELKNGEPDLGLDKQDTFIIPLCCSVTLLGLYCSASFLALLKYSCVALNVTASAFVYSFLLNTSVRLFGKWTEINPLKLNPRYRITLSNNNTSPRRNSWVLPNPNYREPLIDNEALLAEDSEEEPTNIQSSKQLFNTYIGLDMIPSLILSLVLVKWSPLLPIIPMNCAIYAISRIKFKNLKTATLILSSLLVYDFFFVFYTPLKVSRIDLPFKIQLPTGLIGLGDIILPGAFTSLCYKFDIYRWHLFNPSAEFHLNRTYWGIYASTALLSYVLALVGYFFVLNRYQVAHPALLYIAPSQLISVLCLAWWTESFEIWNFHYEELAGAIQDRIPLSESSVLLQEEYFEEEDDEYIPFSQEEDEI